LHSSGASCPNFFSFSVLRDSFIYQHLDQYYNRSSKHLHHILYHPLHSAVRDSPTSCFLHRMYVLLNDAVAGTGAGMVLALASEAFGSGKSHYLRCLISSSAARRLRLFQ
jgi:hypothetical protein